MPPNTNGWICQFNDLTTQSASVAFTRETATAATSVTFQNFTDAMATGTAWNASDVIQASCAGY